MHLNSVNNEESLKNVGDAFVDDAYLGVTSTYLPDDSLSFSQDMEQHHLSATGNLRQLVQKWERLLFSTGGAINLQKSFWVLMGWHWENGKSIVTTPEI
jgi:hypothetical protein